MSDAIAELETVEALPRLPKLWHRYPNIQPYGYRTGNARIGDIAYCGWMKRTPHNPNHKIECMSCPTCTAIVELRRAT